MKTMTIVAFDAKNALIQAFVLSEQIVNAAF